MVQITDQYQFRYIDTEGKEILYTCRPNTYTWDELVREFEFFLRGNGFVFKDNTIFDRVEGEYEW